MTAAAIRPSEPMTCRAPARAAARPGRRARRLGARRRLGLSLPEVLISLAITALLLTAAAAAFSASAEAIQSNDRFFRATQAARISLRHVLSEIRGGSVDETWSATQVHVFAPDKPDGSAGPEHWFKYNAATKQLILTAKDAGVTKDYVLASNIEALKFSVDMGQDYTMAPCVARVSVDITVGVGSNQVRLSGAASPRRNLQYQ